MNSEKMFRVIDSSTTHECPERIHDVIVDGQVTSVRFTLNVPTLLPEKTALKFMVDGFSVVDAESGAVVPRPAFTDETVRNRIGEDEIVAKYEELTDEALQMRAVVLPGGEIFAVGGDVISKQNLIDFLKHGPAKVTAEEEIILDIGDTEESLIDEDSFDDDDVVNVGTIPAGGTIADLIPVVASPGLVDMIVAEDQAKALLDAMPQTPNTAVVTELGPILEVTTVDFTPEK